MISILRRTKPQGKEVTLQIEGMHCTSCAFNIDGALEDLEGVKSAETSYAKGEVKIIYDEAKVTMNQIISAIKDAGYAITAK